MRGLKQSVVAAKMLQKTEIQERLAWTMGTGDPGEE